MGALLPSLLRIPTGLPQAGETTSGLWDALGLEWLWRSILGKGSVALVGLLHVSRQLCLGLAAQRVSLGGYEPEEGPALSPHLKTLNQSWPPRRNKPSTIPF